MHAYPFPRGPFPREPLADCIGGVWGAQHEMALLQQVITTYGTPEEVGAFLIELRKRASALIARGPVDPVDYSAGAVGAVGAVGMAAE